MASNALREHRVITPSGKDVLLREDRLLVAGRSEVVKKLKDQASL